MIGYSTHVIECNNQIPQIEKEKQEQTINSVEDFGSYVDNPIQSNDSDVQAPSGSYRDKNEYIDPANIASLESNNDDVEEQDSPPLVRITNLKPFIQGGASSYMKDNQSSVSQITNQNTKRQKKKIKIYSFYYDLQANAKTSIFTQEKPIKFVLLQSVIPICIVFCLFILLNWIQIGIDDYCYTSLTKCEHGGIKIWSFVRQMILFKLSMIIYRSIILEKLVMGSNFQVHRKPIMEQLVLFLMAISLDFISVLWLELNEDWFYLALVNFVGFVVFLNTFRIKNWYKMYVKGRGYFVYDLCLVYFIVFAYYVLPNILDRFRINYGYRDGTEYYMYTYMVLDLSMEIVYDFVLHRNQWAELYIYQIQNLIMGIRFGTLLLAEWDSFEFWVLLLVLFFFRMNNASMMITVIIRRQLYYKLPQALRPITSMSERSQLLKGKNGYYYENIVWLGFLYLFWISQNSLVYYVKDINLISDGKFHMSNWSIIKEWWQPLIIWIVLLGAEILGYIWNKKKSYDNIKWISGGDSYNILENVLTRCLGWYLFIQGIMV